MPVAVLNVRPSRQRTLRTVRIDGRNREVALRNIGESAILYAPADEPRRGYFGMASITDVAPDLKHRRFIFITLVDVELFARFHPLESLSEPIERHAYDVHGAIDFSYFSPGIRALAPEDREAARALAARARDEVWSGLPGLAAPPSPSFELDPATAGRPARFTREVSPRDRRLRWSVLEAYGAACAVCGDDDAVLKTGSYEVEVCHLRGLEWGGPDALTNAMPMCRKHHWAFDEGLFTLADAGDIIASRYMEARLRLRFNGRTRAHFPKAVEAWPKAEHLQFHRANVFLA
jgi:hypothetical protein